MPALRAYRDWRFFLNLSNGREGEEQGKNCAGAGNFLH